MVRFDDAEQHFLQALQMNEQMTAWPYLAHVRYEYARMLLARDRAGDREKAEELIGKALSTAVELGMRSLETSALELREKLHPGHGKVQGHPGGLTDREVEVLDLMASGKSNCDIAALLTMSINTVVRHVSNIFDKTGATNRVEAATYATRLGMGS